MIDEESQGSSNIDMSENGNISTSNNSNIQEDKTEMKMNVQIGGYTFTAALEQNQAVSELIEMTKEGPVTIAMRDYSGFEKV